MNVPITPTKVPRALDSEVIAAPPKAPKSTNDLRNLPMFPSLKSFVVLFNFSRLETMLCRCFFVASSALPIAVLYLSSSLVLKALLKTALKALNVPISCTKLLEALFNSSILEAAPVAATPKDTKRPVSLVMLLTISADIDPLVALDTEVRVPCSFPNIASNFCISWMDCPLMPGVVASPVPSALPIPIRIVCLKFFIRFFLSNRSIPRVFFLNSSTNVFPPSLPDSKPILSIWPIIPAIRFSATPTHSAARFFCLEVSCMANSFVLSPCSLVANSSTLAPIELKTGNIVRNKLRPIRAIIANSRALESARTLTRGPNTSEASAPPSLTKSSTEELSCAKALAGILSAISPNLLSSCPIIAVLRAVSFSISVSSDVVLLTDLAKSL